MPTAPSGATRNRAAFTLLELLAVISLSAILAGLVLGAARRAAETATIARTRAELAALSAALESYRRAYGDYPQTDDEARLLQSLIGKRGPTNTVITGRPLLEVARFTTAGSRDPFSDTSAVLIDPWGQVYLYAYKTPPSAWTNPGYVLYSIGPDGRDSAALLPGGLSDPAPQANADNLSANRP
ncbi:MAG: type II secretion system protein GspG [bacterium]|nr:type II secretion system protein GspG [bacterium]MDI1337803.1 type II secretion system protein GspG [Lacunisphaera sp.]